MMCPVLLERKPKKGSVSGWAAVPQSVLADFSNTYTERLRASFFKQIIY